MTAAVAENSDPENGVPENGVPQNGVPGGRQRSARAIRLRRRRTAVVAAGLAALAAGLLLSLAVGSRTMAPPEVWEALVRPDGSWAATVVHGQRIPRTLLAVVVGAALGIAGALMQSLTRNPLADPGILGVNAGAGLAVVLAVALTGFVGIWFYLWFAFAGAALASVLVYLLALSGGSVATPVRLALGGVAVSAAASSLIQTVILADQQAFNEFRFWAAGSLEGRGWEILTAVTPFVVAGVLLALVVAPGLNALALGEETGAGLGVRPARVRALTTVAVALLCGAATAAVGPVGFVGLGIPFVVRALVGPDQRWITPVCLLYAPALLLFADVLGRRIVPGSEIQVGIITALVGGPVFVGIARRLRIAL